MELTNKLAVFKATKPNDAFKRISKSLQKSLSEKAKRQGLGRGMAGQRVQSRSAGVSGCQRKPRLHLGSSSLSTQWVSWLGSSVMGVDCLWL